MDRNAFPNPAFNTTAPALIWQCVTAIGWIGLHYTRCGVQFAKVH